MLQSAEMASTTSTRRSYRNPLSFGHFQWQDQMKVVGRKICSSTFEIIEQGQVAHVLDFTLNLDVINGESCFVVKVNHLEGYLEDNILINFDLDVFRNDRANFLCRLRGNQKKTSPAVVNYWYFSYGHEMHQITLGDFTFNAKVSANLQLYINDAKPPARPKLRDKTEPSMEETIRNLCFDNEFSDIKIICEGKEFPCHKLLLSLRSSVFKAMLSSDLKISNAEEESTLKIEDISAGTMSQFIKFLYTDELNSEDIDVNLLIAANKYDLKRLVNICVKHLGSIIEVTNVMEITFTAYLIDNDQLLQKASKFISNNIGAIKKPDQWDQITKNYPHIATKVMNLIVFDNQPPTQG